MIATALVSMLMYKFLWGESKTMTININKGRKKNPKQHLYRKIKNNLHELK